MATRVDIRVVNLAGDRHVCVHALTGRAPESKMCAHNHECGSCPYDQMLDDLTETMAGTPRPMRVVEKAA